MKRSAAETVVAIDWSGAKAASGQRKHIWMAEWRGGEVTLTAGRRREELADALVRMAQETPRMVVGVDFCFSYPAWFVREKRCASAEEFWELVTREGEQWLSAECADVRFWGAHRRKTPAEFAGERRERMFRRADLACKVRSHILEPTVRERVKGIAPKSPFQIGGAGAVGTGSLRGIPLLARLRAAGFSVWPFDEPRLPLLVEIYPRLLTGAVKKKNAEARRLYLRARRKNDALFADVTGEAMREAAASEDAFDALVSVVEMARRRETFAGLRRAADAETLLEGDVWGAGS